MTKKKQNESSYFNFHKNQKDYPHYFLSEELLVPKANNCDSQRLNMYANHINQLVHLVKPEFPKVFTNFENQVGEYSIAYKKAEQNFKIIKKIIKNKYNYDLLVQYEDGVYDLLHFRTAVNITESYGYELKDCISDKQEGDSVSKDSFIYKSSNYSENGDFAYGVNLKALYISRNLQTYEDGIVISESAAEKLKSYKVEKTTISINTNDVLLNLYGNESSYKSLPRIGDKITNPILVASRRKNKFSILYDFQSENLRKIDNANDEVIYTDGGTIVDINIFNNTPLKTLQEKTDEFSVEVSKVLEDQYRYWKEIAEATEMIIPKLDPLEDPDGRKYAYEDLMNFGYEIDRPLSKDKNPNKYTDELGYYWKISHEFLNEKIKWRFEGTQFDYLRIEFTILKEDKLTAGSKISGRYGNKGIISEIIPDNEMPITESGDRAEILLNALGVVNRLNMAQLIEEHINFMSNHVIKLMNELKTQDEKFDYLISYINYLNPNQAEFLKEQYSQMNESEKEEFFNDLNEKGIYIHQTPYFGNTELETFEKILDEHPEWCERYKFKNIEKPLVMGELYFIRLKHSTMNKNSSRSAANLNIKNLPAKSTLKKEKKILYSTTPIRLGKLQFC